MNQMNLKSILTFAQVGNSTTLETIVLRQIFGKSLVKE